MSGQVGPGKARRRYTTRTHFGCFLSCGDAFSYAPGMSSGGDFPNSTALNHAELPLPLYGAEGAIKKDGDNRWAREGPPASGTEFDGQPPATAGMIETPAPAGVAVSRPCSKRTSSSFT